MKNTQTIKDLKTVQSALRLLARREREKASEAHSLSIRCSAHAQTASRALSVIRRLAKAGGLALLAGLLALSSAEAGDRPRKSKNYALRRTEAGQVQGQPLIRRYSGGRTIDVYKNGLMFEGDNVVGIARPR